MVYCLQIFPTWSFLSFDSIQSLLSGPSGVNGPWTMLGLYASDIDSV